MRFTVALAAAALFAGCGGGDDPPVETAQQATACELHLSGGPVFVRFAGSQAADRCDSWIRGGSTWSRTKSARARGDFRRVCVLYRERTAAGLYAADGIAPREQALGCAALCSTAAGGSCRLRPTRPAGSSEFATSRRRTASRRCAAGRGCAGSGGIWCPGRRPGHVAAPAAAGRSSWTRRPRPECFAAGSVVSRRLGAQDVRGPVIAGNALDDDRRALGVIGTERGRISW
jgi:hypothetical protein